MAVAVTFTSNATKGTEALNELIDAKALHMLNASNADIAQFDAQIRTHSMKHTVGIRR